MYIQSVPKEIQSTESFSDLRQKWLYLARLKK